MFYFEKPLIIGIKSLLNLLAVSLEITLPFLAYLPDRIEKEFCKKEDQYPNHNKNDKSRVIHR